MTTIINNIASTARIAASAQIASDVIIEDYVVIEDHVRIASGCHLKSHCVIRSHTQLKEGVFVDCFAVIGGDPQVNLPRSTCNTNSPSGVIIGAHTIIREGVTVHRASKPGAFTQIDNHCMLMAQCHVGHDCLVHSHVTIVNQVLLAGHVEVHSHATLGGGAVVHQFSRIGSYSMIGGAAVITRDIAPATLSADRNHIYGMNRVGLKRAGFSRSERNELKVLYKTILEHAGDPTNLAQVTLEHSPPAGKLGQLFLNFFIQPSRRGYVKAQAQVK